MSNLYTCIECRAEYKASCLIEANGYKYKNFMPVKTCPSCRFAKNNPEWMESKFKDSFMYIVSNISICQTCPNQAKCLTAAIGKAYA